jgi:hypothetical protein
MASAELQSTTQCKLAVRRAFWCVQNEGLDMASAELQSTTQCKQPIISALYTDGRNTCTKSNSESASKL